MKLKIEPMENIHLPEVILLEKEIFSDFIWPQSLFFCEINLNPSGLYFVALDDNKVIGYGGMWVKLRQCHITTLGVHKDYRKRGIGLLLMVKLLKEAIKHKAGYSILEVKKTNIAAQKLYEKLGYKQIGTRHKYYIEDNEDGIVMFLENLKGEKVKKIIEKYEQLLEIQTFGLNEEANGGK